MATSVFTPLELTLPWVKSDRLAPIFTPAPCRIGLPEPVAAPFDPSDWYNRSWNCARWSLYPEVFSLARLVAMVDKASELAVSPDSGMENVGINLLWD